MCVLASRYTFKIWPWTQIGYYDSRHCLSCVCASVSDVILTAALWLCVRLCVSVSVCVCVCYMYKCVVSAAVLALTLVCVMKLCACVKVCHGKVTECTVYCTCTMKPVKSCTCVCTAVCVCTGNVRTSLQYCTYYSNM